MEDEMEDLKKYVAQLETNCPDNVIKIYFSRKTGSDSSKYVSHQPSASAEVQRGILNTVLPYIKFQLENNRLVDYNPQGVLDGELETIDVNSIPCYTNFIDSISESNINRELSSLKVDKIGFYCIEVNYENKQILFFRQFQKLKKLRRGFLSRIVENELTKIEKDFLGIDELTDIIVFDEKIYLLNHISLERVFGYRDEFLKKTNEALGEILTKKVINNIEQFADDCRSDIRIMKRFTNIMTKDRLPLFFENYERVPEIVKELELDLDFDKEGRIIYRERSQLFHIINLLSDSYFKSLLAQRTGIAKLEEEL